MCRGGLLTTFGDGRTRCFLPDTSYTPQVAVDAKTENKKDGTVGFFVFCPLASRMR